MEILTLLYKLLIGPLELFFEVIFSMAYRLIGDVSLSIVALSLAMNFLVLPLYRRADALQEEERDRALAMKPWTDHIKKAFKGDERFMMLQTYNRQNGYKQTDVLKSSLSLLLEIPFFIAAFRFLSGLELLNGVQLGPIADLGAPDALLQIGGISINVLPIIMTIINVVSAAIYLRGFPLNSKIQTYGIAAIFLILLYNSPAGLVFYWTLNNVFSLVKNIFYKLKNPRLVLSVLASLTGIVILIAFFGAHVEVSPLRIAVLAISVLGLQAPIISYFTKNKNSIVKRIPEATESDHRTFFFGTLFLALLCGALIPIIVIQTSPAEFVSTIYYRSPLYLIAESSALALGTFVVWFGVFYWLATPRGKTIFNVLIFAAAGIAIVNYLFFGNNYGNLSSYLQFDVMPDNSLATQAINLGVVAVVGIALALIWRWKKALVRSLFVCLCIASLAMVGIGAFNITSQLEPVKTQAAGAQEGKPDLPRIQLSKSGKNVVVIMLDRAIPGFVPYIMHEKPELKDIFSGFTVYSNAIAYGTHTNVGNPAIFGGSDYRPTNMNERPGKRLGELQDEALKLMPTLFDKKGYTSTIFDPPFAGYSWKPDVRIYDDIPSATAYVTEDGLFYNENMKTEEARNRTWSEQARNFFCYSIFKVSPLILQPILYQRGGYNSTKPLVQIQLTYSVGLGLNPDFMNSYSVLTSMPAITSISDNPAGNLFIMTNSTTHAATILKEPEYTPATYVDNTAFDQEHTARHDDEGKELDMTLGSISNISSRQTHYEINVASYQALGEWFNYLKEQGVYDNTRIILVSDHSWPYVLDDSLYFVIKDEDDGIHYNRDARWFNCLLMVKDFNSTGFNYNTDFMTTADVPVLAMDDIVENPKNPYTGSAVDMSYKNEPKQYLLDSDYWVIAENNGEQFLPGRWFSVKSGNTADKQNWQYLGYY